MIPNKAHLFRENTWMNIILPIKEHLWIKGTFNTPFLTVNIINLWPQEEKDEFFTAQANTLLNQYPSSSRGNGTMVEKEFDLGTLVIVDDTEDDMDTMKSGLFYDVMMMQWLVWLFWEWVYNVVDVLW